MQNPRIEMGFGTVAPAVARDCGTGAQTHLVATPIYTCVGALRGVVTRR